MCVCEQIARERSGDKGFKNVPAPARQTTPLINPENYIFRFPQHKKWVIQNSCPKVGRSFFGKKGQHFLDSVRSRPYYFSSELLVQIYCRVYVDLLCSLIVVLVSLHGD